MSLTDLGYTVAVILLVLAIVHTYQVKTIPRKEYVQVIFEQQEFLKREWINEILIRGYVSKLIGKEISERKNSFNLQHMLDEKLLEHRGSTTWFSGEVEVPIATFRITDKGICKYKGSPP